MIKVDTSDAQELTEEQSNKLVMANRAKHSEQHAIKDEREEVTADSTKELKRKKSKSDLEREKRESDKLMWRDDHLNNPSAAQLKCEIEKYKN